MFFCTFAYMCIWVHTGEVGAKRLRERYLEAVLRQDIAFFDDVGAGAVATHIQTDTREYFAAIYILWQAHLSRLHRSCPTRHLREIGYLFSLPEFLCYWVHLGLYPQLEACPGDVLGCAMYFYYGSGDEHTCIQEHANVSSVCSGWRKPSRRSHLYYLHRKGLRYPESSCRHLRHLY
jgi:hypothetical protein